MVVVVEVVVVAVKVEVIVIVIILVARPSLISIVSSNSIIMGE